MQAVSQASDVSQTEAPSSPPAHMPSEVSLISVLDNSILCVKDEGRLCSCSRLFCLSQPTGNPQPVSQALHLKYRQSMAVSHYHPCSGPGLSYHLSSRGLWKFPECHPSPTTASPATTILHNTCFSRFLSALGVKSQSLAMADETPPSAPSPAPPPSF